MGNGLSEINGIGIMNYKQVDKLTTRNPQERRRLLGLLVSDDTSIFSGMKIKLGFHSTNYALPNVKITTESDYENPPCYASFHYRALFSPALNCPSWNELSYFIKFNNKTYPNLEGKVSPTRKQWLDSEYTFDVKHMVGEMLRQKFIMFNDKYPKSITIKEPWENWWKALDVIDSVFCHPEFGVYICRQRRYDDVLMQIVDQSKNKGDKL